MGSRKADLEAKIAKLTLRELQKEVAQLFAWKKDVASRLVIAIPISMNPLKRFSTPKLRALLN